MHACMPCQEASRSRGHVHLLQNKTILRFGMVTGIGVFSWIGYELWRESYVVVCACAAVMMVMFLFGLVLKSIYLHTTTVV